MLGIALSCAQAPAHEVHSQVAAATATAVTLTYADGQPFSFEGFELFGGNAATPLTVGRTDGQGRAVFIVPPEGGEFRLRAFSADGHGVDLRLTLPAAGAESLQPAAAAATGDRGARLMFGLGLLLGLFGLIQLLQKRKGKRP